MPEYELCDDDAALAERAFALFTEAAHESIAARGRFTVALTGGSGPKGLYQQLAKKPGSVDWARTFVFLGDERFVPYDDKDSNFGMCKTLLLDHVLVPAGNVLPIPTGTETMEKAAADYAATLTRVLAPGSGQPPTLDLILLGMGDDGHCASLFPGKPTLDITDVWAVGTPPGTLPPPVDRVTVTFPVLNAARRVLFLVPGAGKAEAVRDIFEGNPPKEIHPSVAVQPTHGTLLWLLDTSAASLLNSMMQSEMEHNWQETAQAAGMSQHAADAAWQDLSRRYTEPGRAYHTLTHIAAMLAVIEEFAAGSKNPLALRLAAWFHDAVYDARRQDNEEESARYVRGVLEFAALPPSTLDAVERLILTTKTHTAAPDDGDAALLLDADLAVLGAVPADYDRYAQAIRQEYGWVPEDRYRTGRRKVLASFLERPRLYHTPALFARLEKTARANLRRELGALQ